MEAFLVYGFATIALVAAALFVTFRQPVHAALGFAASVLAVSGLYLLQRSPFVAAANVVVYAGATIIIFLFVLMFAQKTHLQVYDIKSSNPVWAVLAAAAFAAILIYAVRESGPVTEATGSMMSTRNVASGNLASENMVSGSAGSGNMTSGNMTSGNAASDSMAPMTNMNSMDSMTSTTATTDGSTAATGLQASDSFRVADLGRVMYTRYLWTIELAGAVLLVATIGAILIAQRDADVDTKTGAMS